MVRAELKTLSRLLGVVDSYRPSDGGPAVRTSDGTRVALLEAMGVDASTEASAARERARLAAEATERIVEPCRVVPPAEATALPVRHGGPAPEELDWEIELRLEDGRTRHAEGRQRFSPTRPTRLPLGGRVPVGHHELVLRLGGRGEARTVAQDLVVTPSVGATIASVLRAPRFGLAVNLYSVRGSNDMGVGDLGALRTLIDWTSEAGGTFVGINPLQAQRIGDGDVSPYSPSSRIFRSAVYVDVRAVPELKGRREVADATREPRSDSTLVEYAKALERKDALLRTAHRLFERAPPRRRRAYERFVREWRDTLQVFATFEAIQAHLRARGRHRGSWRSWPSGLRDARSAAVERFRETHQNEIDFHCFVQFEIARQLHLLQRHARRKGMEIGLYHDLPVGVSGDGADTWAWQDAFARGARIGAPPDDFQPGGQDWGLPPLVPHRLGQLGYRYWVQIVRAALRDAGAVRIDHAMGLDRQYWVAGSDRRRCGAYVAQPFDALMGIVALESRRAGALVIAEDLGTVPSGFRPKMARYGALCMRILPFERTAAGGYRSARTYPSQALVAANTHDLPSLPAFWSGADLKLRARLEAANDPSKRRADHASRERDRAALLRRLVAEGHLRAGDRPTASDVVVAVHRHLAASPAALLSVSLDDVAGETDPVNLPGVPSDVYPSWTRRMHRSLAELATDPDAVRALDAAVRRKAALRATRTNTGRRARPRTSRSPARVGQKPVRR